MTRKRTQRKRPTRKQDNPSELSKRIIRRQFRALRWTLGVFIIIILALIVGLPVLQDSSILQLPLQPGVFLAIGLPAILVTLLLVVAIIIISSRERSLRLLIDRAFESELGHLRSSLKRSHALQEMATTLRATLSLDKVLDSALNVSTAGLQEMGIAEKSIASNIMLYDNGELIQVAHRRLARDTNININDQIGVIGEALQNAEPIIVHDPQSDPNLAQFDAFRKCYTVICVPLRVGFQIYGIMIIGSEIKFEFDDESMEHLHAVADQAVIALQNAQLYVKLEDEKQRLIEAETEARKELARDLHDGPTQSVAAIAMRINFVRSLLTQDPEHAMEELYNIEELAKDTGKEIRGMLFTLRPLVLETQGLGPAIETVMERIHETDGINMRLVGGEYAELINPKAQGVLFYIIEEALGNARKHSKANTIEVRFWQEGGLFVARVQDDGVGFDVEAVTENYSSRGSLGMVNMQERADTINGSIKLESVPGQGTVITVVVPLDKQGQHATA